MSWIDDAKKDAQAELQREIEERNRKIAAEKLAQENERNRKIELFRQHTDLT